MQDSTDGSGVNRVVYFAVGPHAHEIICPFCHATASSVRKIRFFQCCARRQYCSRCGEYLGSYKRP